MKHSIKFPLGIVLLAVVTQKSSDPHRVRLDRNEDVSLILYKKMNNKVLTYTGTKLMGLSNRSCQQMLMHYDY